MHARLRETCDVVLSDAEIRNVDAADSVSLGSVSFLALECLGRT